MIITTLIKIPFIHYLRYYIHTKGNIEEHIIHGNDGKKICKTLKNPYISI